MFKKLGIVHKWIKTWGALPVWSWVRAAEYYEKKDFRHASELYKKGLETHLNHPAGVCAAIDLANCFLKLNRLEDAESILVETLSKNPNQKEVALRLIKIYDRSGNYVKSSLIWRDIVKRYPNNPDYVARFILGVLENGGPSALLQEAVLALLALDPKLLSCPLIEVARAALIVQKRDPKRGRAVLAVIAGRENAPFESYLWFARALLKEGSARQAREWLTKALELKSNHPEVLSLLAQTYLFTSKEYEPEFAVQLATSACQNSNWLNPLQMHTLAQAFYQVGDRMSALLVASKAKEVGRRRFGVFKDADNIDRLIEELSSGTLA
ncbi:MAG: tetratricopeptide repeat protein [Bdellovibrionota bacterium]|jgi:tetratricopeptide (TPR) repeat protein